LLFFWSGAFEVGVFGSFLRVVEDEGREMDGWVGFLTY